MNKTRRLIDDKRSDFPEFQYYHNILDKIEENVKKMPDIAIESCKSLIEGVSKTILKKLKIDFKENGRGTDQSRELLNKVLDNIPSAIPHDPEFINRTCGLVCRMTEIRNKRGDVSHGKVSPKEEDSDVRLAQFIAEVTDSIVYYVLETFFVADLSSFEEAKYEDNEEFNQFLDSENELDGISYSEALFYQDPASYEEQLKNYLAEKEEGESN
ncbi:MAG: abortive infection family protein [Patescibacteria group bacterium]|nr:abortive infection family protein [Patescibacteria group bacterium]